MKDTDLGLECMISGLIGVWIIFGTEFTVTVLFGLVALFMIYAVSSHGQK